MKWIAGVNAPWSRRAWLTQNAVAVLVGRYATRAPLLRTTVDPTASSGASPLADVGDDDWAALARRAVDAAGQAGADYADARLTRTIQHRYPYGDPLQQETETVGIGVRALVKGYWGFAASPSGDLTEVEQLAQHAVTQAKTNARGTPRTVDITQFPRVVGTWSTPVRIDPFAVSVEEKVTFMRYWEECARRVKLYIDPMVSHIEFTRQDRMLVTSTGTQCAQRCYESGGKIVCRAPGDMSQGLQGSLDVAGIETAGRGWELFLDANIPDQIRAMPDEIQAGVALQKAGSAVTIGRYPLVCDGATMAALLGATLGIATQLDRSLGYEANAGGTSFLNDPLSMLGTFNIASPSVTVTANRTASAQLATVKWDDEGVAPPEYTLIKDGILQDFQTTCEQAAWLAPYYSKHGRDIHSNGCAAAEDALNITLQHMPNLALVSNPSSVHIEDLVSNVKNGIMVEHGMAFQVDSQVRSGLLTSNPFDTRSRLREIKNGRLGRVLAGGAILFDTLEFWRHVIAVGGAETQAVFSTSQYPWGGRWGKQFPLAMLPVKGEPPQATSHSVQAAAATIINQPLINVLRKA